MFEPTEGCPHLQPIELMQMAEKAAMEAGHGPDGRKDLGVVITESTPKHMFKVIRTTMTWNGTTWMVSNVDRLLKAGDEKEGVEIVERPS
jgi:hypothetical protein